MRLRTYAPACTSRPTISLNRALGVNRFGPTIAPIVVDHTTSDRSRPRVDSAETSVATNRACRFTALIAPRNTNAISTTGNSPNWAPITASTAPTAPSSMPVLNDVRLSYLLTILASGTAQMAAPIVVRVAADPPQATPAMEAASRLPMDRVMPLDRPIMIWANINPASTFLRAGCAAAWVVSVVPAVMDVTINQRVDTNTPTGEDRGYVPHRITSR